MRMGGTLAAVCIDHIQSDELKGGTPSLLNGQATTSVEWEQYCTLRSVE